MNVAIHSAMNPLRTKTYYGIPNNVINKTLNSRILLILFY